MLIATGAVLALLTWAFAVVVAMTVGLLAALVTGPRAGSDANGTLRRALWWGVLVVTIFAYLANLLWPLRSAATAVAGLVIIVILGVPGWLLFLRARRGGGQRKPLLYRGSRRSATALLYTGLAAATGYFAVAVVGPVTNFDSGLYHLTALQYSADYATVPGLANLFFAFGYGNAEFPLAALLGNGPWAVEGYRLLNGLLLAMVVVDLVMRLRARRMTAGTPVLLVAVLAGWVPMVALSDYWVTSPSQDSAVMAMTFVATAYLVDAVAGGRTWLANLAAALALSTLLVLLRPTMAAFAVAVVAAGALLAHRRRGRLAAARPGWVLITVVTAGLVAGVAATARDYVLSGWLQYPLSVFAFDVPWLAPDPTQYREATLGYHRDSADLWGSVDGWAWVGPWLSRLPSQWETFELLALVLVAVIAVVVAARRVGPALRWRALALALAPLVVALVAWWTVSPPSFRFAWGLLFGAPAVVIGWSLWRLTAVASEPSAGWTTHLRPLLFGGVAAPLLLVTGYSSVARFDPGTVTAERTWSLGIQVPYAVAAPVEPVLDDVAQTDGLTVRVPQEGQCWMAFPLCTYGPEPGLRLLGPDIAGGFASGQ